MSKNISHVNYIATRSGVDKTLTEADLFKELGKGAEQIAASLTSDEQTYLKYINERPRSHGLFDAEGVADPQQVQEEIAQVQSYVWRGIISLKEEDAKELGYLNKEQWQNMLRKKMPDIAAEMGIKITNFQWVGAVHMEKGHPHTHVMFWEKEPERLVGVVAKNNLNNIRKALTDEVFEEERFQLLNEKNVMRDLIRDLAKNDISQITGLIKDIKMAGKDLSLIGITDREGIAPHLYNDEEKYLIEKIKNLADMMPGKGRIALKFMPENIKEEVQAIADYLLAQPELGASLAQNLQATEALTRLYTGKDDAVEKARENAYQDIRDRLCQIILRGATESKKDNFLFVNQEKADRAVEFIKGLNRQINLISEQTKVLTEIITVLDRTGHADQEIFKHLQNYVINENIHLSQEALKNLIQNREKGEAGRDINVFDSSKKLKFYLTGLKLAGYSDQEALQCLKDMIGRNSQALTSRLDQLKENGLLKTSGGEEWYHLTNKGIDELLKIKDLDRAEKAIFKVMETTQEEGQKLDFDKLLKYKGITENLRDAYPADFVISRFDIVIREMFGEDNRLTLKDMENAIYVKYSTPEITNEKVNHITDGELVGKEFEIYKNRLDKLTINGLVSFDKNTGTYSFTKKGTDALHDVPAGIQFTKYDATVTLGYIDKANGILTNDQLRAFIEKNTNPKQMDKEFANVIRRLNGLKKLGYLEGQYGEYKITITGAAKRTDVLQPEKALLKEKLQYLERLGLLNNTGEGYELTERYIKYMKDITAAKELDQVRTGTFPKDIAVLLDRTQNRINPVKLANIEERLATEKYLNGSSVEMKTDYQSIRTAAGIQDSAAKTINTLAITLMVSGLSKEEAATIIHEWNTRTNSGLDPAQLDKIIEKVSDTVQEDRLWGRTTIISVKDWKSMFESFGLGQKEMPKWIYQGENWKSLNGLNVASLVNNIWKSAWGELQKQRLQTEAQAEMLKKQLDKQTALQNKKAMMDEIKKNQDRSSLYREDELER